MLTEPGGTCKMFHRINSFSGMKNTWKLWPRRRKEMMMMMRMRILMILTMMKYSIFDLFC